MRKLLLALPLASTMLLAGCCAPVDDCNTCGAPVVAPAATCNTCVNPVPVPANAPVKVAAADSKATTMSAEEYQALLASGKVREVSDTTKVAVKVEPKVEVSEPVVEVAEVAEPVKTVEKPVTVAQAKSALPTIPAAKLPEGWDYISEQDLSGGALNNVTIEQYYSQLAEKQNGSKDI